jgi:hypothetical protein
VAVLDVLLCCIRYTLLGGGHTVQQDAAIDYYYIPSSQEKNI